MVLIINPKVCNLDLAPTARAQDGRIITPDEVICEAAGITFKEIKSLYESIVTEKPTDDQQRELIKKLIRSAGRGHASMTTSVNVYATIEGDCSKFPDALLTGAPFASALMSSSRRVPITIESILVPEAVVKAGAEAVNLYMKVSEANIRAYDELILRGVEKEDAAKIVQYGHRGSGIMDFPLETLIGFDLYFEHNPHAPKEARQVIDQLKTFVKSNGAAILYEARKAAARPGYLINDIFHTRKNQATEFAASHPEVLDKVQILGIDAKVTPGLIARIKEYQEMTGRILAGGIPELIENERIQAQVELLSDYNNSLSVETAANTPLRVWGEVKRHRTLRQCSEPLAFSYARAETFMRQHYTPGIETSHGFLKSFKRICSLPETVEGDMPNLQLWVQREAESLAAMQQLQAMGVPFTETTYLLPRGTKQVVLKKHDLINFAGLYMPVRLCDSAENEMKALSFEERDAVLADPRFPEALKPLVEPKCAAALYCLEGKCCGAVRAWNPVYNGEYHKQLETARTARILGKLKA